MRARIPRAVFAAFLTASLLFASRPASAANLEDAQFYGADALYQGLYERAERGFSSALDIDPKDAFALAGLGDAKAGQGKLDEADAAYEKALAVSPDNLLALRGLGLTALARNERDKAAGRFGRMLELDPGDPKALTLLGLTAFLGGDRPTAAAFLERAAKRASADDFRLAGRIYEALGMPLNARVSLERSLEEDASNLDALERLGALYQRQGETDLAQSAYRQALSLSPQRALSRAALARLVMDQALAAEQEGQSGKAAYLWSAVLEYDPGNVMARSSLNALKPGKAGKAPGKAPEPIKPPEPAKAPVMAPAKGLEPAGPRFGQ